MSPAATIAARQPTAARIALLLIGGLLASPALAHVQQGQAAGFLSGLMHPASGLEHVLAMVAVGPWGAQLGTPAIWPLPRSRPWPATASGRLEPIDLALRSGR